MKLNILRIPVGALQANCYIVYDDQKQAVVIDPGAEGERILGEIRTRGLTVQEVMLTHVHFDHMQASKDVVEATGAGFVVPEADAPALTDGMRNLVSLFEMPEVAMPLPTRLVKEGDCIQAGNLCFTVIETPGHTPGSCCFLCGDVLFTGDTLFQGSSGRTDFPGGSFYQLKASLEKLANMEGDFTVLPGHDGQTTLGYERINNPFINEHYYD